MTNSIAVWALTCLAFLVAPVVLRDARAETAEMGARLAAASELLEAMGGRQSIVDQIDRVVPLQMQALQTQFPSMTAETRRIVETSMRREMNSGVNQLLSQMANAWARRFSAGELRQIAAFHRSPAGQRLRSQQEDLQREISDIGRSWGTDIGRRVQERIQEHLTRPPALTS